MTRLAFEHGASRLLELEARDALPRQAERLRHVLVREPWITEHRTQSGECSLAMGAVKPGGADHVPVVPRLSRIGMPVTLRREKARDRKRAV